ncbi:hypothetical protein E2C01_046735 [Portunus trituberculatus]|uniref:Uncharacterized protein n=1 Tax=Portunus trituberculatus TaxID=210409 RepID=A0A5B7G5X7_PORTR|nr:hypothetical protein [Portunus trituberculatus]
MGVKPDSGLEPCTPSLPSSSLHAPDEGHIEYLSEASNGPVASYHTSPGVSSEHTSWMQY